MVLSAESAEWPAVLQFCDERGEVRAEYVRGDVFDAVVDAWQGRDRERVKLAVKGIEDVRSERERCERERHLGGGMGTIAL